jgi:hypothetical protein
MEKQQSTEALNKVVVVKVHSDPATGFLAIYFRGMDSELQKIVLDKLQEKYRSRIEALHATERSVMYDPDYYPDIRILMQRENLLWIMLGMSPQDEREATAEGLRLERSRLEEQMKRLSMISLAIEAGMYLETKPELEELLSEIVASEW